MNRMNILYLALFVFFSVFIAFFFYQQMNLVENYENPPPTPPAMGIGGALNNQGVSRLTPITQQNIKEAVNAWISDPSAATTTYGNISDWDTSAVTDMNLLFYNKSKFNSDISKWNTSNVISMYSMFANAYSFNQPIGKWDTAKVNNMLYTFLSATSFNQPIGEWDTKNVTNMSAMFANAKSFNQPIDKWDTENVTNMSNMFANALAFNQPIGIWDTVKVTDMTSMFANAKSFNQPIAKWDTKNVTDMLNMFANALAFNQPKPQLAPMPSPQPKQQSAPMPSPQPNPYAPSSFIGSCMGSQYGCCPDESTSKSDSSGSNCKRATPCAPQPNPNAIFVHNSNYIAYL